MSRIDVGELDRSNRVLWKRNSIFDGLRVSKQKRKGFCEQKASNHRVQRLAMVLNEITGEIIGAAIKIHRVLGPGLLESAYEACLAFELTKRGFHVERQLTIPVVYEDVHLECGFRADLVVERKVIVELKAKESLRSIDHAQILSHLRLMDLRVGLLINFHEIQLKDGIHRIVNNFCE